MEIDSFPKDTKYTLIKMCFNCGATNWLSRQRCKQCGLLLVTEIDNEEFLKSKPEWKNE